jgi:hypothetical protein
MATVRNGKSQEIGPLQESERRRKLGSDHIFSFIENVL